MCRKGRGVKRRGAAWDGDVVSDEERILRTQRRQTAR